LKKLLIAGIGTFILGIFNTQRVNSAIYTHTLNYTNSDHGHSLTGRVSFDDSNLISSNYPDGIFSFGSGNFITNITFTYTNNTTNQVFTLTNTDFDDTTFGRVRIEYSSTPDFNVADLTTQLTDLAFRSENTGSIQMSPNINRFELELNDTSGGSAIKNDFELNEIVYHSPGPLPIFGFLTAFSSMKKLKRKYKNQQNYIIN